MKEKQKLLMEEREQEKIRLEVEEEERRKKEEEKGIDWGMGKFIYLNCIQYSYTEHT